MPLVQINVIGDQIDPISLSHLAQVADGLPMNSRCVILIHGFKFNPQRPNRDPHRHILSASPAHKDPKVISWPRQLGFHGDDDKGLCIAFGWQADGSLPRAYHAAQSAALALSRLVSFLNGLARLSGVSILAHSLGARVALDAIPHFTCGNIDRAVLMAPAEFRTVAKQQLQRAAEKKIETLIVTSWENTLFDPGFSKSA